MAIPVHLMKRTMKGRQRNGQSKYRWTLRWIDPATGQDRYESTGTADRTQAETLRRAKWEEINGLVAPEPEPKPVIVQATWQECKDAFERAMKADNLRPRTISDALLTFESVRRMFPEAATPGDITPELANEYKRRRAEAKVSETEKTSPWTIKGDLSMLRAVFGKWLMKECGLLMSNPFANVRPPKCDEPDVRIVSAVESTALFDWLAKEWNNWRLPIVYLEVAAMVGWRATELASMREDDILPDGYVRVLAGTVKTRKAKYGWLPAQLQSELRACGAGGWAFGRFADELRRRLILCKKRPHQAARVKDFAPQRLVGWLQDELQRFHADQVKQTKKAGLPAPESFTLHDFRRTAITGLQMAGVSEKEASVMVGATPEVIRKHYEKLDQMAIAKRGVERRLGASPIQLHKTLCAERARGSEAALDTSMKSTQTQAG